MSNTEKKPVLASRVEQIVIRRVWIDARDKLPKPMQKVVAFIGGAHGVKKNTRIVMAAYAAEKTLPQHDDWQDEDSYDEATDEYWCDPGWVEIPEFESDSRVWPIDGTVTHWMPLPDSPDYERGHILDV